MRCYGDATQFRVSQFAAVVEFTPDAYWLTSQTEPTEAPLATIGSGLARHVCDALAERDPGITR